MKVSACRFSYSDLDPLSRLVIAGHNYKIHFGRLGELSPGGRVSFTPMDGDIIEYEVDKIVQIDSDDVAALYEGEWDLTLLTCNFDLGKRLLVRCKKI